MCDGSSVRTHQLYRGRAAVPSGPPDEDSVWGYIHDLPAEMQTRLTERVQTVLAWGLLDGMTSDEREDMLFRLAANVWRSHARAQGMARQSASMLAPCDTGEVVYYIRFGDRIKIGTTANLHRRLQDLPYDELLATEPGGRELERVRHEQFRACRAVGEWHFLDSHLLSHIAKLPGARKSE